MKFKMTFCVVPFLTAAFATATFAESTAVRAAMKTDPLAVAATQAISTNKAESASAIEKLREAGSPGLDALFTVHAELIARHSTSGSDDLPAGRDGDWQRLKSALDAVGQQRDCHASHLFWFTDMAQAKELARATGKPILSLRLLGNLDEEYSCANSRFFRTTLYANTEVSEFLRDHFVLHWRSVRPVPRITIDFGDGRRIERTITGNSIHYVLDSDGNPIDALPGLYGPRAFIAGLTRAENAFEELSALDGAARAMRLREYHQERLRSIEQQWRTDLARTGQQTESPLPARILPASFALSPSASAAAPRAMTKSGIEVPFLRQLQPDKAGERGSLENRTDETTWQRIAALHSADSALDSGSRRLIREKTVSAADASRRALSKRLIEDPMIRVLQTLERSIAEDTVRNEYLLHSRIHEWFANGTAPTHLDALNAKVYAELFLTPDSDPWLGLAPADVFSALDNGGLVQPQTLH